MGTFAGRFCGWLPRVGEFGLDLFDGWQFVLEVVGQGLDQPRVVAGDADGFGYVAQGIFGNDLAAGFAQDDPDGRLKRWASRALGLFAEVGFIG